MNQSASGKRVLVTGGAIGDIPVILEAKSMGYEVFTSGNRENDPGHKFSDHYIKADYSNVFLLSEIMSTNSITYLIPSCHDIAYVTASKVAEKFKLIGFDDHELSERIHRKDELAVAIQEAGLRCIESELIKDCDDALEVFQRFGQRVVVKPTDMTGGRGVSFVFDLNHLSNAIQNARNESISKSVLIQKYISGTEHGFTAILKERKVIFSLIDDEYRFLNRYRVAGTISPSTIGVESRNILIDWINRFSEHHKLVDGLIHLQFIQTQNGPYVLELCRRPPGDLYPYFVEASTGYPYIRNLIRGYLGLEIEEHANDTGQTKTIFRHVVMGNKNGIYKGLLISDHLKTGSNKLYEFKKIGENISDFLTETIAVYIFEVSNQERLKTVTEIQSLIRPIID